MKFITENKKRKKIFPNGYSLVEVLVSLVILSLGLLGIVYLMNSNIKSSQNSRNQIIASELAQEGVELVQNIKTNNGNSGTVASLINLVVDGTSENNDCRIDYTATNANWSLTYSSDCNSSYNDNSSDYYTLFQNGGFYMSSGSGGTRTKFARRIAIQMQDVNGNPVSSESSAYEIRVRSIVTWDNSYQNVTLGNCTVANHCVWVDSIIPE